MATVGQSLTAPEAGWKRYDDTSSAIKYSELLSQFSDASAYGGTLSDTQATSSYPTARIRFDFEGTQFRIISAHYTNRSSNVSISIDGGVAETFTQYDSSGNVKYQTLSYEKTGLTSGRHTVEITMSDLNLYLNLDAIDTNDTGRLLHPDEVTDPKNLAVGKRIRAHYSASTSGSVGTFSNLGKETFVDGIKDFIPAASSATPSGDFYYIMVDTKRHVDRYILVADRNIQHSITWDTLNSSGIASGSGLPTNYSNVNANWKFETRLLTGGIASTDGDNEWTKYIVDSTLNNTITAGSDAVWHWSNVYSWSSTSVANSSNKVTRGNTSVNNTYSYSTSGIAVSIGFRPVLEVLYNFTPVNKYLVQDGTDIKKYVKGGYIDIVSEMTSHTSPSPYVASASSEVSDNYAWKIFDKKNDSLSNSWAGSGTSGWVKIDLGTISEHPIKKYVVHAHSGGDVNQNPKNWYLEGSNDDVNWTVIDSRSSQTSWSAKEKREFECTDNNQNYQYYKMNITSNNGDTSYTSLGELELFKYTPDRWTTIGTSPVTKAMFDSDGMTGLASIDNTAIQALTSNTPELLTWTNETNEVSTAPSRTSNYTAIPSNRVIKAMGDINVGIIESVLLNGNAKPFYSNDLVPTMTSNTSPEGVASASSFYQAGWEAFRAFDDIVDNYGWAASSVTYPQWLSYEFSSTTVIDKYSIEMHSTQTGDAPKDWTFEGYDGTNWIVLDTQSGISFKDIYKQNFFFDNANAYKKYRVNITSHNGGPNIRINQMEMMKSSGSNPDLKVLVSGDSGTSWKAFDSTLATPAWVTVDPTILTDVKSKGMTPNALSGLTASTWSMINTSNKLRFAFYFEQAMSSDSVELNDLTINTTESFVTITTSAVTEADFVNNGMSQVSQIPETMIETLPDGFSVESYSSDGTLTAMNTSLVATPVPKFITPTKDIDLTNVTNIDFFKVTANQLGNGIVKLIASVDGGTTWNSWDGIAWVTVDSTNLTDIELKGMTPTVFNGLSGEWNTLRGTSNTIRFGYYLEMAVSTDVANTDQMDMQYDVEGYIEPAVYGTDYKYKYKTNTTITIEFLTSGDYKINYTV